ncbi:MAG: hypothetical protein IJ828_00750 [Treponema sp.]|nr:hypothetical protein [Treponema sp.]
MTEIELKAHVDDRTALIEVLDAKASYKGRVMRDDEYYGKSVHDTHKIRIRKEICDEKNGTGKETFLITYKRKEIRTDAEGTAVEVNDEKECSVSSTDALKAFLTDTGYSVQLKKHKDVMDWELCIPAHELLPEPLTATFELCAVPPLGDFLEIEILSPRNDEESVAKVHKRLEELLELTGIPKSKIEKRYYSEMLRATEQ